MVDCHAISEEETDVENVQVTDIENAAYLFKDKCNKVMLAGSDNGRSPEAYFRAEVRKVDGYVDMFSFRAVV